MELIEKDNKLEECHRKIDELHEQLKLLEIENRMMLTQKSQEELERIQLKKQSLTLDLKHTTTSNDVQTDTSGLADSNNGINALLKTSETETCDTFHTANSDCSFASALPSPFPPRQSPLLSPEIIVDEERVLLENNEKTVMSDSGVYLENNHNKVSSSSSSEPPQQQQPPTHQTSSSTSTTILQQQKQLKENHLVKHLLSDDGDNLSTNSSQHNNENNNFYEKILRSQMEKLREDIVIKKAEIMKTLEMGGEKIHLDEMINDLQEIQKEFVKMEMRLENLTRGKNNLIAYFNQIIFIHIKTHRWLSFRW